MKEKTLLKIEKDIENHDLGKARERLHGLIHSYPSDLSLRKKLGDIYFRLHYPTMAGRYWYLEENKTPEMIQACQQFEKSLGNSPNKIVRALKFKGDSAIINNLSLKYSCSVIQSRVIEQIAQEPEETWKDNLVHIGCISIVAAIFVSTCIGLYTIFNWLFS
ncbi:TPA: DNA helicase [Bacillus pseudomycoides]|nr:DNA helicase [Bacillus pseudomycoides]